MRKAFINLALLLGASGAAATQVTVNLPGTVNADHFVVTTAAGTPVDVGENTGSATKPVYRFDVEPGEHWLSIFRKTDDAAFGSILVDIPDQGDAYTIDMLAIYAYAGNRNEDNTYWTLNEDYTIPFGRISESANQGVSHKVRPVEISGAGSSMPATVVAFPALKGDSYTVWFVPDAVKRADYTETMVFNTLTSAVNAQTAIPLKQTYTITVPEGATLYVGQKPGNKHYVRFIGKEPVSQVTEGGKTTYTYALAGGKQTYNYRVTMDDYIEHAGKFGYSDDYPKYSFEITREEMESHGKASYVNHNVADMSGGNVADLWLNINIRGHLLMNQGATYQLAPQRNWQLIDDQSNNYFVDPKFHYTVLDENFRPSDKVLAIDADGKMTAMAPGTAIVQVRYDALYAYEYNRVDGFGNFGKDVEFWFGSLWSSIWAENTGLFVVTVGANGECSATPNFVMDHENPGRKDTKLDSEIDVLYYFEDQPGYVYTLRPLNAAAVAVANPMVDSEANTVSYAGFKEVTPADDGSYSILLTFGRNIIRVTDAQGRSVYQVISAKPVGYEVTNATNPENGSVVYPGETANVVFHGLFNPAGKLAGIYNQSAFINYNGTPNGNSLILTPNQYAFAGTPSAQTYQFKLPEDAEGSYDLSHGSLYVRGYGSLAGKHRVIDPAIGVTPNFTAAVTAEYWGFIPDVSVPVVQPVQGAFEFRNLPADAAVTVKYGSKVVAPADDNAYLYNVPSGVYTYSIASPGYIIYNGRITVDSETPVDVMPQMAKVAADDHGWDGRSLSVPYTVGADELGLEGLEGYYKIGNGYELAWLAEHVNSGNKVQTGAVLTSDIDLGNHLFTPIDVTTNNFLGNFYGRGHSVDGLNVDITTSKYYAALFGNLQNNAGTISHLTVRGKVTSTRDYAAGLVANSRAALKLVDINCEVDVDGAKYVGGVVGYMNYSPSTADAAVPSYGNLHHRGSVKGTDGIGGVIGYANFNNRTNYQTGIEFSRLTHEGDVEQKESSTRNASAGGLAGTLSGVNLTGCYAFGNVAGQESKLATTGKLIGLAQPSLMTNPLRLTGVYACGESDTDALIGTAGNPSNASQVLAVEAVDVYVNGADSVCGGITWVDAGLFADGRVARMLGAGWGQQLDAENSHPVLDGPAVYEVTYTTSLSDEEATFYTNGALPEVELPDEYASAQWLTAAAGGQPVESVSGDCSLYLLYTLKVKAESIVLDPAVIEAAEGTAVQITATVLPADTFDKTLVWTSSDGNVATVDADGLVTILHQGTCTITATAADGSGVSADCEVSALTALEAIFADGVAAVDVYTPAGVLVATDATAADLTALHPGVYVARGIKFRVK